VEFILYFGTVSRQYYLWGALWIVQGFLFLVFLGFRDGFLLEYRKDSRTVIALGLFAFTFIGYPLTGFLTGHGFPAGPVFGTAPCPVTIFTFAMVLLHRKRMPVWLIVIPFLWSLTGIYALLFLGVYQDAVETASGLLALIVIIHQNSYLKRRIV
jgi:hypothetical protein